MRGEGGRRKAERRKEGTGLLSGGKRRVVGKR